MFRIDADGKEMVLAVCSVWAGVRRRRAQRVGPEGGGREMVDVESVALGEDRSEPLCQEAIGAPLPAITILKRCHNEKGTGGTPEGEFDIFQRC